MPPSRSTSTEALLAESAWLRNLARHMLRDESRAEDAVQDTLAAAIERPPEPGFPPRRWLAKVLRNFVRQEHRARTRRGEREIRAGARTEAPATVEVVERLAVQRRVVDAVNALDEPYRTAIVLRFLDGLPPREVARRTGAPVKTVHTRVERGLAKLRIALDSEYGGRRGACSAVLIALAGPPLRPIAATTGVLVMSTKMKLALSAGAVLALGFAAYRIVPGQAASPRESAAALPSPDTVLAQPEDSVRKPLDEKVGRSARSRPRTPEAIAAAPIPEAAARPTFTGFVVDEQGLGVPGLVVRFEPTSGSDQPAREDAVPITSGPGGEFEMELPRVRGLLFASGRGYGTVVPRGLRPEMPASPPRIVVAGARSYAGTVVDELDRPLAETEIAITLPTARAFELSGSTFVPPLRRASTDTNGAFRFEEVGFVAGASLEASHEGFQAASLELPDTDDLQIRIALQPIGSGEIVVLGEVVDASGSPIAGAWVGMDHRTTTTDGRGAFRIAMEAESEGRLHAVHAGYLPAEYPLELDAGGRPRESGPIVLVLDGRSLSISGRVVDAAGDPIEACQVWTFDGQRFGQVEHRMGELDFMFTADVETLMAGGSPIGRGGRDAATDAQGRFELTGLLDRSYAIHAMHPATLEIAGLEVQGGTEDLVLRLAGDEPVSPVAGRVVTYAGDPIQGARISVFRTVESGPSHQAPPAFNVTTDEDGAFRFEPLCVERTYLVLARQEGIASQRMPLSEELDLENLLFRAPVACHVQVFLDSDPTEADSISIRDADGHSMTLTLMAGSTSLGATVFALQDGRSDLFETDESAATLVLYKDGDELRRVPLSLKPGQVNEIHL